MHEPVRSLDRTKAKSCVETVGIVRSELPTNDRLKIWMLQHRFNEPHPEPTPAVLFEYEDIVQQGEAREIRDHAREPIWLPSPAYSPKGRA